MAGFMCMSVSIVSAVFIAFLFKRMVTITKTTIYPFLAIASNCIKKAE